MDLFRQIISHLWFRKTYAGQGWKDNNDRKRRIENSQGIGKESEEGDGDHLQSTDIAVESIFVMNCGLVTPTAEPILLLQGYKFFPSFEST